MKETEEGLEKENLSPLEQGIEVVFVILMLLLFSFLVYHQTSNTGFFTDKFGSLEMLCLYVPILFGIAAPAVRAGTGMRNPARPFEAIASLLLALGSAWLVIVFPFNYAHLADVLPGTIRFVLTWVTDDIGKIILLLQVFIGPISALLTMWKYISIRQWETESYPERRRL